MDINLAGSCMIFIIIGFILNTIGIIQHNKNSNRMAIKGVLEVATANVHNKCLIRMDMFDEELSSQRMYIWTIILGSIMMVLGGILIVFLCGCF
ncbi:MAG: hypothetical protein LUQ47_04280 [Methanotrichaceae archaeon]|nr:hypothetical protein [Methanotrichaceae archaeon]